MLLRWGVRVDERVLAEWRAAEVVCLFDALVCSGVEVDAALMATARPRERVVLEETGEGCERCATCGGVRP